MQSSFSESCFAYCCLKLISISLFVFSVTSTLHDDVILYDSSRFNDFTWAIPLNGSSDQQPWKGYILKGTDWKVWAVCEMTNPYETSHWLRTTYIDRKEANLLYINMTFSMRTSDEHPEKGSVRRSKETMVLYFLEADWDFLSKRPYNQATDTTHLKFIDTIASDAVWTSSPEFESNPQKFLSVKTRSVPSTKKGGYFFFEDQGSCLMFKQIVVYYRNCPSLVRKLTHFPKTPTGIKQSNVEEAVGTCVSNASAATSPKAFCQGDGSWLEASGIVTGQCQCDPGFEPDMPRAEKCIQCSMGKFKSTRGNVPCQHCPKNSYVDIHRSVHCVCRLDYFRAPHDDTDGPCTRPPSAPRNLRVSQVKGGAVFLNWDTPERDGERNDLFYRATTERCDSAACVVDPRVSYGGVNNSYFSTRTVAVRNLQAASLYRFTIESCNGVSAKAFVNPARISVNVSTDKTSAAGIARVEDIVVTRVTPYSLSLSWRQTESPALQLVQFQVEYYNLKNQESRVTVMTSHPNVTLANLHPDTSYYITIDGFTISGIQSDRTVGMYATQIEPKPTDASSVSMSALRS